MGSKKRGTPQPAPQCWLKRYYGPGVSGVLRSSDYPAAPSSWFVQALERPVNAVCAGGGSREPGERPLAQLHA